MLKEIGAGVVIALLIFLGLQGINVWPLVLLALLVAVVIATGIGSRIQLGTKHRLDLRRVPVVSFQDIGGQTRAKNELIEALEFVLRPEDAERLGIRPLKGILLTGPPGTGKTLLAKAAANHTESAFVSSSGSEFVEMYAGVGAQRVRQLFQDARQMARKNNRTSAIIFIDEIEVMAGKRGQHHSHLEYDQTLNQLLVEMDGMNVDDSVRVLVMAATNRADLLDPALLRPGRIDRTVRVDLPDRPGREAILMLHARNKPLDHSVDFGQLAAETFGFSGAHLESVCNEAAILALREGAASVSPQHFKTAVDKVMLGERLDHHLIKDELYRVAIHEGGHAIVGEILTPGSVASITIAPRGMALGFVRKAPADDRILQTVSELKSDIAVCLAGSSAERLLLGEQSTGAANDFEKAWDIAKTMVATGLSSLGVVQTEALSGEILYQTIHEIIRDSQEIVDELIGTHETRVRHLAELLLEHETLSGERVREVVA